MSENLTAVGEVSGKKSWQRKLVIGTSSLGYAGP